MQQNSEKNPFLFLINFATRHFAWIAFGVYASGFSMWNIYLSHYGFFEYNFIQTRFLSAGLLIWLPIVFVSLITVFLLNSVPKERRVTREVTNYAAAVLVGIWFPLLFLVLFPQLPQAFGGAKPISVSILGTPEQIDYLANFAIGSAENAQGKRSVQTYPICLIYQNDQYILFFNANQATSTYKNGILHIGFFPRVISLSRTEFLGFQEIIGSYSDTICGLSGSLYNGIVEIPIPLVNN